jgi:hypothetical protein
MSLSIHDLGVNVSGNDLRPSHGRLLAVCTTLILLLATLTGFGAGVLTYLGGQPWPMAVLAGGTAAAAAAGLFDRLVS